MLQLNKILQYKNVKVIDRFLKMYDVDQQIAEDIFQELLKYLYLSALTESKRKQDETVPSMGISFQMMIIDEMWHAFILNTRDYQDFCDTYLSEFIHHPPAYYGVSRDYEESKEKEEFSEKLSYIFDILGEETIQKWFSTYADEYTFEKMNALRK